MAGIKLYASLVVVVIALGGCSMMRLGYEALPTLISWQVGRYLDLDDGQRAIVGRRVEALHQWHQHAQLPYYAEMLREVRERVEVGVATEDLGRWREQVAQAWEVIADRMAPGVAELALTLRSEQVEHLRERLAESAAESRRKMLPDGDEARYRARQERVVARAEFFLGGLGGAQQKALQPVVRGMPAIEEDWLAEREARNQQLLALLNKIRRERPSKVEATRLCREFLRSFWRGADAQRRQRIELGIVASDALTAKLVAGASPKQRQHLLELLEKFSTDFESLAASAASSSRARGGS